MERSERICLGAVVGVHGIKGEVKVKSFTEVDRDLDKYGPVENKAGDKVFSVKVTGHSKELLRVKIKGVDDRNLAETLVGMEFYVSKSALPEPEEDEYYHADLIGLTVREKIPVRRRERLPEFITSELETFSNSSSKRAGG